MSLPDRHNPYSFEAFLDILHGFDFYTDDPPFEKLDARFPAGGRWSGRNLWWKELYQETALQEVGPAPIVGPGKMSLPELWD